MPRHGPFSCALPWPQLAGLLALSLFASLAWLTDELLPARLAPLAGQGLHLLFLGLMALALAAPSRSSVDRGVALQVAAAGVLLSAMPFLLLHLIPAAPGFGVLIFSLIPVGALLLGGDLRLLPWALAGVAGLLLLIPFALPESARGLLGPGLVALAAASTLASLLWMRRLMPMVRLSEAVAAVGLAGGAFLSVGALFAAPGGWSWGASGFELLRAAVVDLPATLLLLWLLRRVSPVQVATYYLLAPLMTLVEGWMLVREALAWRMAVGMALLAGAVYGLLRVSAPDEPLRIDPH